MWITIASRDGGIAVPQLWSAKPGHEVIENWRVAGPDQELKGEVRIMARRGKRATYVQTGLSEKKTWKELKGKEGGFTREGASCIFDYEDFEVADDCRLESLLQ